MTNIAVFGAAGNIGSRIVAEAASRGHQVTAVAHDPSRITDRPAGLRVVEGGVFDADTVSDVLKDQDAVVLALGGAGASGDPDLYVRAGRTLVDALRALGDAAPRLLVVGGAGSLEAAPGVRVMDSPGFPEVAKPEAGAAGRALDFYRTVTDVQWTFLSPAKVIAPGDRTGTYRTGTEQPVEDANGESRISTEDYAVAMIDEIENPRFAGRRFTVGY